MMIYLREFWLARSIKSKGAGRWSDCRGALLGMGLFLGCGGPDFNGTYTGNLLTTTLTCSDGSTSSLNLPEVLTVTQQGDQLTMEGIVICTGSTARISGTAASLDFHICRSAQSLTSPGTTVTITNLEGTLTLLPSSAISVDFREDADLSGSVTGVCVNKVTGMLARTNLK